MVEETERDGRRGKDYLIYRCPQASTISFNEPICKARTISGHKLDNIVWKYVSFLIQNRKKVKEGVRLIKEQREKEKSSNQVIYDDLLAEKNSLRIKNGNLLELFSEEKISKESKENIKTKLNEFDEREKLLDNQLAKIKGEIDSIEDINAAEEEIERMLLIYQDKINNPTFEIKRDIVKRWISEINILDNGQIRMKVKIPEGETAEFLCIDTLPITTHGT